MAAEEVHLRVGTFETRVDVTFTFVSEGPARTVLMGFPVGNPQYLESRGDPDLHDFAAWLDGEPLQVRREKGVEPQEPIRGINGQVLSYPQWITFSVPFEANQTRTVRNTYRATNYYNSIGEVASGYILQTGRVWKGPIGSAVITVELDGVLPGQIFGASPTSYRWEGERMVWRLKEFEPERDIVVRFRRWPGV